MRYFTRAFLSSFVPMAAVLLGSLWVVHRLVESAARNSFRSSLRETQEFTARQQAQKQWSNARSLRIVAENPALKAALQLVRAEPANPEAYATLADQLEELNQTLGFEVLMAAAPDGRLLAGLVRAGGKRVPLNEEVQGPPAQGLWLNGRELYLITAVPVNLAGEHIANLSVGEPLELSDFATAVVLERRGRVIRSTLPDVSAAEIEEALRRCSPSEGCDLGLRGATYHCLPLNLPALGHDYRLYSLRNLDRATAPTLAFLRRTFVLAWAGALVAGLLISTLSSRSIVRPIATIVRHLHEAEHTGRLAEFCPPRWPIRELDELAQCFRRASVAVREADEQLRNAYVQFVALIASALDARDHYTAGHSHRVSELSRLTAEAMGLSRQDVETIRVAALLHDIGKIGIPDVILRKPDKLTPAEREQIELHPLIGRRILEQVEAFAPFLPVVELHHENWDGTGYPYGLKEAGIPLAARIVHVVDAYDAMTSDRPYRTGMSSEEALATLHRLSGSHFDPAVVAIFSQLDPAPIRDSYPPSTVAATASLRNLLAHLKAAGPSAPQQEKEVSDDESLVSLAGFQHSGARPGSYDRL
jgi:putative nucleotidyltransferase with HDIG domain